MKPLLASFAVAAIVLACLSGSSGSPAASSLAPIVPSYFPLSQPVVDIPTVYRQHNHMGSCGFASAVDLCRWVGAHAQARDIWANYSGGSNAGIIADAMKHEHLPYVQTSDADLSLLKWAILTRRGCAVGWNGNHVIVLVGGVVGTNAILLDNNPSTLDKPVNVYRMPWSEFRQHWDGWAFALVLPPPPPLPSLTR